MLEAPLHPNYEELGHQHKEGEDGRGSSQEQGAQPCWAPQLAGEQQGGGAGGKHRSALSPGEGQGSAARTGLMTDTGCVARSQQPVLGLSSTTPMKQEQRSHLQATASVPLSWLPGA